MADGISLPRPAEFLYREAWLLDRRQFDAWLELYTPDCLYWIPAWRDDGTQTEDPDRELSLIYYRGRRNLEDRVRRIRSGNSVASQLLPRVSHLIGNVVAEPAADGGQLVRSSFIVNVQDIRTSRTHSYFGHYEHGLVPDGDSWRISRKIISLMNDVVPTALDVYAI